MPPPATDPTNPLSQIDPSRILNINIGILGHVDSGKTSLVKTLSTLLSTASLDKSLQSRQRGMTLDLGFSAFLMELPTPQFDKYREEYSALQITLVDCPGHASLIRTIIGGAQIIDMVLLVVDVTKGVQTQTGECLVIAEMTTDDLIVVLNKVDKIPASEREKRVASMENKIRGVMRQTRFGEDVSMVGIAAAAGGEKVAAAGGKNKAPSGVECKTLPTENIEGLLELMKSKIQPPQRDRREGKFHFAIDHCFPIKGQGTVITGTVLSGAVKINSIVEFPELQGGLEKKVKSMQMFRRQVKEIAQGDRAGICFSNLDAKLIERGIAASPGSVKLMDCGIAVVKRVRYFKDAIKSGGKFHVSIGHATVMATVTFFGAKEIREMINANPGLLNNSNNAPQDKQQLESSSLNASADIAGLPRLTFDFDQDFLQIHEMESDPDTNKNTKPSLHWALLHFQTPVYCPLNSLIIGSRLDTDIQANTCRLAFSGRLVQKFDPKKDTPRLKIYNLKEKIGSICRLGPPLEHPETQKIYRHEVFGNNLFKKETNMTQFIGKIIQTSHEGETGVIQSSFGTSGKFKVFFPAGTVQKEGEPLFMRFKRYVNDEKKEMHQDYFTLPEPITGKKIESAVPSSSGKSRKNNNKTVYGEIASFKKDSILPNGKPSTAIVSGFFSPEVNIKEKVGMSVIIVLDNKTREEGKIVGSFGKAGKCKVLFENGVSVQVGHKVGLVISSAAVAP